MSPKSMTGRKKKEKVTIEDAKTYVSRVKDEFKDKRPNNYVGFLKVLKDYKDERIDMDGAVKAITKLFEEHRELLAGMNDFLPNGYKIILPPEEDQKRNPVDQSNSKNIQFMIRSRL